MKHRRFLASCLVSLALLAACGSPGGTARADVDVDLTALSSTMVYSEVFDMVSKPEDYVGKTVRMEGFLNVAHDVNTDSYYYTCLIQDATACCAQGIEFVLDDPASYPEEGEDIVVVGTFDTYEQGSYTYCTLRNAYLDT